MKILIIEDEPLVARDIQMLIQRLEPRVRVLDIVGSVKSANTWLSHNAIPDLILSDIQLSDGISFEIFEHTDINCPIIFTTAYDEYAMRAFKVNSIDYLLKPIDENELLRALQKFQRLASGTGSNSEIQDLIRQWRSGAATYKERFLVSHGNTLVSVPENDVAYFHKDQLVYLHTQGHEKHICDMAALDDLESLLNPQKFFRVNRQFIIHILTVSKVRTTHKGLTVVLKPPFNLEIDISREKATAFKKWLD